MDQAHDVIGYFQEGLEGESSRGKIWHVIEPHRGLAVFNGWAKDEPFTAIVFIGFPSGVTDEDMAEAKSLIDNLDEQARRQTNWSSSI